MFFLKDLSRMANTSFRILLFSPKISYFIWHQIFIFSGIIVELLSKIHCCEILGLPCIQRFGRCPLEADEAGRKLACPASTVLAAGRYKRTFKVYIWKKDIYNLTDYWATGLFLLMSRGDGRSKRTPNFNAAWHYMERRDDPAAILGTIIQLSTKLFTLFRNNAVSTYDVHRHFC